MRPPRAVSAAGEGAGKAAGATGRAILLFFWGGVVGVVDRVEREKVREKAKMTRRQFFFHFSLLRSSERASEQVEKRSSFLSFSCAPFPAPATMLSARSRLSLLVRGTRSSSSIDEALRGVGSWATVCADGMGARDGPAKAYNLGEGIEIGLMASFSPSLFRSPPLYPQHALEFAFANHALDPPCTLSDATRVSKEQGGFWRGDFRTPF